MRWAQPILRLSRRACARANDGLASVNAGQPLMKNLSHFVKSVLYMVFNTHPCCVSLMKNLSHFVKSVLYMVFNTHPCCERMCVKRQRAGALVQWLRLPAWKVKDRGFEPHSGPKVSESCVWRALSSHSSHHPQDVLLAQCSLCAQRWPKTYFISQTSKVHEHIQQNIFYSAINQSH